MTVRPARTDPRASPARRRDDDADHPKRIGTLTFFCGKMGAGKSTLASSLSARRHAVLLSEDTWLEALYPGEIHSFDDYLKRSANLRPLVRALVQDILRTGTSVIMDFPANTVRQRQWFLRLCAETGCGHEMFFLDLDDEQCLARIARRRVEQPERNDFDTEQMFRHVTRAFEPPSDTEGLNVLRPD